MKSQALVIGGTGPTGPFVVAGLAERGYGVTILHGGQHEVEFAVPDVKHIHTDPHFRETLERALNGATFDLVIAQYGRLSVIAEVLRGKTERLIAIGGATAVYAGEQDLRWGGLGRPALFPDTTQLLFQDQEEDKLAFRMVQALTTLFDHHASGAYSATYIGYPNNYGPRQPGPQDWCIIRRALERRRHLIIADGGTKLESRVYSETAAKAVMCVVDHPEIAAGKRYSVADECVHSMRQRIEYIARLLDHEFEMVDMPYEYAWPCYPFWRHRRGHRLCQSTLIRAELGFADAVSTEEGLKRTVEWFLSNRPEPGGEAELQIGDPFDYPKEDELISRWQTVRRQVGPVQAHLPPRAHVYRHPKTPGEAWRRPVTPEKTQPDGEGERNE